MSAEMRKLSPQLRRSWIKHAAVAILHSSHPRYPRHSTQCCESASAPLLACLASQRNNDTIALRLDWVWHRCQPDQLALLSPLIIVDPKEPQVAASVSGGHNMRLEDLFEWFARESAALNEFAVSNAFDSIGFSDVVSVLAFVLSIAALYVTRSTHSDEITSNLIHQNFADFIALHTQRAQFPYHGHLFELDDQYGKVKNEIATALRLTPEGERQRLLLRLQLEERALARRIFSQYENAFYQWRNTSRTRDKSRLWFHKDVADYFASRLLRNPRLAWFWSEAGENYRLHYEPPTREHYANSVVVTEMDSNGPFGEPAIAAQKRIAA